MASALMYMAVLLQLLGGACAQSAIVGGPHPGTGRFRLPEGGEDGIYQGFVDENGETHVKYLGKFKGNRTSPGPNANLRGIDGPLDSGVHCLESVNSDESFQATSKLANYLDHAGRSWQESIVSKVGSVFAYGCDYGNGQTTTSDQIWEDALAITKTCTGWNQAGWYGHESWKSAYGRCAVTSHFC